MLCPVCKEQLTRMIRYGVEIDYCRCCRGVWLDRGELEKIITYTIEHEEYPEPVEAHNPTSQKMDRHQVYPPPEEYRRLFFEKFFDLE